MGRTALALTLALALACALAGAGCGGGAAGAPQQDAAPLGADAQRDVLPADDAAPDASAPADAADGPAADATRADGALFDGLATDVAPADAPPADAPPADARPDGGCSQVSLLQNGDFELGNTVWTEDSTGGFYLIYATADLPADRPPQAGAFAAWLAGYDDADDLLWQEVAVPAGATALRLTGYRSVATQETGTYAWDFVRLELRSTTGAVLETLLTYTNLDATPGWQAFQASAQSAHAGASVRLALRGTTDAISNPTDFLFDTLALEATVCQ